MDSTAEALIKSLLSRREQILWVGQPVPRYMIWSGLPGNSRVANAAFLCAAVVAIQPVTLGGMYMAWVSIRAMMQFDGVMSLLMQLGMLLIGLLLFIGPWWWLIGSRLGVIRNSHDTYYVMTNFRVMILQIEQRKIVEEYLKQLRQITPRIKMLRKNGVGDVVFDAGGEAAAHSDSSSTHWDIGFEAVEEAESVFDRLCEAMAAPGGGSD